MQCSHGIEFSGVDPAKLVIEKYVDEEKKALLLAREKYRSTLCITWHTHDHT